MTTRLDARTADPRLAIGPLLVCRVIAFCCAILALGAILVR